MVWHGLASEKERRGILVLVCDDSRFLTERRVVWFLILSGTQALQQQRSLPASFSLVFERRPLFLLTNYQETSGRHATWVGRQNPFWVSGGFHLSKKEKSK